MKRNYYTIHKNKKPKKLPKGKAIDPFALMSVAVSAMGAAQSFFTLSQSIPKFPDGGVVDGGIMVKDVPQSKDTDISELLNKMDVVKRAKAEKELAIFNNVINTAKALTLDIPKQKMLHKFRTTGRYVK